MILTKFTLIYRLSYQYKSRGRTGLMSCFRLDHHPVATGSSSPAKGSQILGGDNKRLEVLLQQSMNGDRKCGAAALGTMGSGDAVKEWGNLCSRLHASLKSTRTICKCLLFWKPNICREILLKG
jgi:hypothetical protein